jgi:hypothetical protein
MRQVEVREGVDALFDGADHQVVHLAHIDERGGDRLRPGQVNGQASGRAANFGGHGVGAIRGAAGDDDGVAAVGESLRYGAAESAASADDDRGCHDQCSLRVDRQLIRNPCRSRLSSPPQGIDARPEERVRPHQV